MVTKLDKKTLEELKVLIKNKELYERCSLNDVVSGLHRSHCVLQARLLHVRECDDSSKNWYVSTFSSSKTKQVAKGSNFYKFYFCMCCRSGATFCVKVGSRYESACILQRESHLTLGGWLWLIDVQWKDNARLGHREASTYILHTNYPFMEVDLEDSILPSSPEGFPLNLYASAAEGSMSAFWFSCDVITLDRSRYITHTCPRLFCDRKTSLGYQPSSTKMHCRCCTADMHSESRFAVELQISGTWNPSGIIVTVSGRKVASIFIEKELLDISWEAYELRVPNRLLSLREATSKIVHLINTDKESYWILFGWVMYGQTRTTHGDEQLCDVRRIHCVELVPFISDAVKDKVRSLRIGAEVTEIE